MDGMNKGYAFGFLIVLLVIVLGFYVAYTGFVASRETLRAQPAAVVATGVAQSLPATVRVVPTVPATGALTATLAPGVTASVAITLPLVITEPVLPANPPGAKPSPQATEASAKPSDLPSPRPEATSSSTPAFQLPTSVPEATQQFRLAGPPAADPRYPICCYIFGTVRDAAGKGLEGIRVQAANEWTPPAVAVTKGGTDLGKYDIPVNTAIVNWEIVLVDAAGNAISTKVQIHFDANASNGYRVDWQRSY
jgi:hypothetical protein